MRSSPIIGLSALTIGLFLAAGCSSSELRTFEDEGSVCLGVSSQWDQGDPIAVGDEISVSVLIEECVASCAQDVQSSCTLEPRWGGYVVRSEASYTVRDGNCADICMVLQVDCGTITVGEGEVLVQHGEEFYYLAPGEAGTCMGPDEAEPLRPRLVAFDTPPGQFCADAALQPDDAFTLSFLSQQCLSSSCTTDYELSCTFTQDGQQIVASVSGTYGDRTFEEEGVCTEDCGIWTGDCSALTLAEGTYTIQYGEESYTLEIPGQAQSCL